MYHSFEVSSAVSLVVGGLAGGVVASCWAESVGGGGVATLENLTANSSNRVIRRVSSASGDRDLAPGRCSEVT